MNGEKIKNIRLSKKLGLNETAKKAGISGSYLSNIEKGIKTNPSTETLQKIADTLGVSINEFFDEENTTDKNKNENNMKSKDIDIRRIERARNKMPLKEKEKMMKILEASFEDYFDDED